MTSKRNNHFKIILLLTAALFLSNLSFFPNFLNAKTVSKAKTSLWDSGYALLPEPQKIEIGEGSFKFGIEWKLELSSGVTKQHIAVKTLLDRLNNEFNVNLPVKKDSYDLGEKVIQLAIRSGSAAVGKKEAISRQAYVLELKPDKILICGNDNTGLFYGVQTFLQLLGAKADYTLPVCKIEDWPDLELRISHWCEKEHQSKFETLIEYIDRAVEFKINGIGWHIENTFKYEKHPVIGVSTAFTKEQIRELDKYARERYIELFPILDFPAHMSFVLKYQEFVHLRELPESSYFMCPTKRESWNLIFDMIDELLEAFQGKYFHFSTDELFYLGDGPNCGCAEKVKELGPSGMFVEIMRKAGKYLEDRGKEVMFWGERPLEVKDIRKLPSTLIDAVAGDPIYEREGELKTQKEHGMRVLVYFAIKGGEKRIFPDYVPYKYHKIYSRDYLDTMQHQIYFGEVRNNEVLGNFTAAWDDHGANHEVIWLGLNARGTYGWHAGAPEADEIPPKFMRLFYGLNEVNMEEAYELMNDVALFWTFSWDRRKGIDLPHLPDFSTLYNNPYWKDRYSKISYTKDRHLTSRFGGNSDGTLNFTDESELCKRLIDILNNNLGRVLKNKYNIEVFLSIAKCWFHNVNLFETLAAIEDTLSAAHNMQRQNRFEEAVLNLMTAEKLAENICEERKQCYQQYMSIWKMKRFPSSQVDIFSRESNLNLEKWIYDLKAIRQTFALKHQFEIPEKLL